MITKSLYYKQDRQYSNKWFTDLYVSVCYLKSTPSKANIIHKCQLNSLNLTCRSKR